MKASVLDGVTLDFPVSTGKDNLRSLNDALFGMQHQYTRYEGSRKVACQEIDYQDS